MLTLVVVLVDSQKEPKSDRSHKKDPKSGIVKQPGNLLEGVCYLGPHENARTSIAH